MPVPRESTTWALARFRVPRPSARTSHSSALCQKLVGWDGLKCLRMAPWMAGSAGCDCRPGAPPSASPSAASSPASASTSSSGSSASATSKKSSSMNGRSLGEKGGERTIWSCTSRVVQYPASLARYSASSRERLRCPLAASGRPDCQRLAIRPSQGPAPADGSAAREELGGAWLCLPKSWAHRYSRDECADTALICQLK
mmetsp:Transcript_131054/g.407588  ORF Transcript_131054/g.407588 Transcript_131054/m.407588 type:complete len:200 (-) Transcript_131054:49-648(-)